MNLHRVIYSSTESHTDVQEYFASAGDASKRRTALKGLKTTVGKPEQEAIEVPTNKAELIAWLNTNAAVALAANT